MATIGDTATAKSFLSETEKRARAIRRTFDTAVTKLRESAQRTQSAGGKELTPWTEEELSAAINRLHSYFYQVDVERPEIPAAHEARVRFGFALGVIDARLEDLPGQSAEWFPQAHKDATAFLSRPRARKSPAPKGASRTTRTGTELTAVS